MIEYTYDKVNEKIYKETLDNGIDVYLYPYNKTKNFYCTISVKYGSKYTKYKINNKTYDIIPGTAHFLEHRVMVLGEDEELSKRINDLGSLANAWTGYHATNYNIFGSENIIENIKILLDLFHHPTFVEKDIDEEKGIITEEIDMCKDQINRYLYDELMKNVFKNAYCKDTVIGEKEDINKMSAKYLKQIYTDFYSPNNTFIVILGNFDKDEVMEEIKKYYKNLKLDNREIPKRIIEKEDDKVNVQYEEIKKDSLDVKIKIAFKMRKDIFNLKDDILVSYLHTILKNNFSPSSKTYEKYKNEDLIVTMSYFAQVVDDHVILVTEAITNNPNEFIEQIKNDFSNLTLNEENFEIAKKSFIKNYVMSFENIEDIEYKITNDLTRYNEICFNEYEFINNIKYKEALKVMKKIDTSNMSIIRTVK